jgi:hypothetical protein
VKRRRQGKILALILFRCKGKSLFGTQKCCLAGILRNIRIYRRKCKYIGNGS